MKTLAITGIGGFVGTHLTERALARGWRVKGLEISEAAAARVAASGANVLVGDINDGHALAQTFNGADVVVHTAAVVGEGGARAQFERVNIEGTRSVCVAASAAGVKRLVQISSTAVYGFDYPPNVNEAGPFSTDGNVNNETKLASEKAALAFNTVKGEMRDGLGVIVLRPGDVYGADSVLWVLRPVEMLRKHQFAVPIRLPGGGEGVVNHVYIDNLIDAIFLAIESDACGEAFNITDGVATACRIFFQYHVKMAGRLWLPLLPAALLRAQLGARQWTYELFGKKAPALPSVVAFLLRQNQVSCEKAVRELGYVPKIGLEEGMQRVARQLAERDRRAKNPALSQ